jgi:hypothetical protein
MSFVFDPSKVVINLEKIRANMAKVGRRKACLAGARVIAEAMAASAPVLDVKTAQSNSLDPGDMKEGMRARVHQVDGEPEGLAGPTGKNGNVPKVAYVVEYGHRMVKGGRSKLNALGKFEGSGKVVGDVPAYPFLRPAFESSANEALEAMGVALGKGLKEAVK